MHVGVWDELDWKHIMTLADVNDSPYNFKELTIV